MDKWNKNIVVIEKHDINAAIRYRIEMLRALSSGKVEEVATLKRVVAQEAKSLSK